MTTFVGRQCKICVHRRRPAIDASIAAGEALMRIAAEFKVTRQSLARHRDRHLRQDVLAAKAAAQMADEERSIARGGTILERMDELDRKMADVIDEAMHSSDQTRAIPALREMRKLVELRARLSGELKDGATGNTTVNLTYNDFRTFQTAIVAALDRPEFTEAKLAVIKALGHDAAAIEG